MFGLEKLADWWESEFEESQRILQEWVNKSDSDAELYAKAAGATLVHTAMTLGGGLVDVLRLGEGIKEGGTWGYAQDALRLLSLAGPVAKLGRLGAARWTFSPRGPWCASVATAKALRHTGTRMFVKATEIMAKTGMKPPGNLSEFIPLLRQLKARFEEISSLRNINALETLTHQNPRAVILFGVEWISSRTGKSVGHALYAFRDLKGMFKIADRTGSVVKSLSELERMYPGYAGISSAIPSGSAIILKNAIVVEGTTLMSQLAFEVNVILTRERGEKEAVIIMAE